MNRRLREGWVLVVGMVVFGCTGAYLIWDSLPSGLAGVIRVVLLVGLVLFAGGVAGPMITKAVRRRR